MTKLSEEEIKQQELQFLEWQKRYNETGDKEVLWFQMRPYLVSTAKSMLKKFAEKAHKQVLFLDDKSEEVADIIVARYVKDKSYSKDLPKTMVYWAAFAVAYSETSRSLDAEKEYEAMLKERLYDEMYRIGEIE